MRITGIVRGILVGRDGRGSDPKQPFAAIYGDLLHWEQGGATDLVTFRTADSLPKSVRELLKRQRDDWRTLLAQKTHDLQREFHREIATKYEAALDQ